MKHCSLIERFILLSGLSASQLKSKLPIIDTKCNKHEVVSKDVKDEIFCQAQLRLAV